MTDLLQIKGLSAGYGAAKVLSDISVSLADGCSLALLGRNGTGKTTLINSIVGLTTHHGGTINLANCDLTPLSPHERAHAGIGWVPQERNIFRSLSVEENISVLARPGPWTLERVYSMFPRLKERRANMGSQLSGGEQQMLAIGRALALNPKLLLLDEPLEGLAPIIVDELLAALRVLARDEGLSMIVVEQKAHKILTFTDEAIILDRGMIVHRAKSSELIADSSALETHLGAAAKRSAA